MSELLSRRRFLQYSAVAAGALLAACAPKAEEEAAEVVKEVAETKQEEAKPAAKEPVEIIYWHPWGGTFGDLVDRIAAAFMEDYPEIKVTVTRTEWDVYMAKLLTGVAAGNPPDVAMMWNSEGRVYTMADKDGIVPLEAVAAAGELEELEAAIHPPLWEIGRYKGKVYGVAQWAQHYMIYYDKGLFDELGVDHDAPPKTFDELDEFADTLYEFEGSNVKRIGFTPTWMRPFMPAFDGQWLDADGAPSANHPNNIQCLEWMSGYGKRYGWTKISEFRAAQESGSAQNPLLIGRYAMEHSGPWNIGVLLEYRPEGWEYGLWPVPEHPDHPGSSVFTYGDIPVIPRNCLHPEAAWQLVKYLTGVTNPEAYAGLFMTGRRPHMPMSPAVAESSAFKKVIDAFPGFDLFLKTYYNADRYVYPFKTPIADYYGQRQSAAQDRACLGEQTAEEALNQCQDEVMDEWEKYLTDQGA